MNFHEIYIQRCIELSKNGLSAAMPNPSVGAVIVYNNEIIGEGFTSAYGGNHAEVNAINSVKDKSLLCKSTIYVSLEPCSHFGKTPPCCDLIIKHKIPNVVIGTIDPNSKVSGNGIKRIKESGANVMLGILEQESIASNKRFFTFHKEKRPYIILKWAESSDGFIAPASKEKLEPFWLTNEFSRQLVHKWRSEEQAILVGTTTVLDDNPKLNVRDWNGKNPTRIVLDKSGKISENHHVFGKTIKTIFITEKENFPTIDNCIFENVIFDSLLAKKVGTILHKYNLQSVIIEGGSKTLQTFIDANLWDEARVFISKIILNEGIKSPKITIKSPTKVSVLEDELLTFENHDKRNSI